VCSSDLPKTPKPQDNLQLIFILYNLYV
jgi:hypothetical protein